jgi:hypothetical protein
MLIDWVRIDETSWRAQLGDYRIDLCYNQFRTWMAVIEKPDGGRISTIGGRLAAAPSWSGPGVSASCASCLACRPAGSRSYNEFMNRFNAKRQTPNAQRSTLFKAIPAPL